jgi:hypothetical protein
VEREGGFHQARIVDPALDGLIQQTLVTPAKAGVHLLNFCAAP